MKKFIIPAAFMILIAAATAIVLTGRFFHSEPIHKDSPDYANYDYSRSGKKGIIHVGTQPNSLAGPALIEIIGHDRILEQYLSSRGWVLKTHGYRNGNDMMPYCDGRLDIMMLGDIPALIAVQKYPVGVFMVCRQGYNAVIARKRITPVQLKGLRIGYPPKTTAHFTFLRTLKTADLSMDDVVSVPLQPDEAEAALKNGSVDAVALWEPFLTRLLTTVPESVFISRSDTYSYILANLEFNEKHHDIFENILASFVRAARWLNQNDRNVRDGLEWLRDRAVRFQGRSSIDVNRQWVRLLRSETVENPSFPMLPLDTFDENGIIRQQFDFLKSAGILSNGADWEKTVNRFHTQDLPEIVRKGARWKIERFDYASKNLYVDGETHP
jgi:hypothetical protein